MLKLEAGPLIKSTLPSSISQDKTVQDICDAISLKVQEINRQSELILLLPRLDELSEELIDELAWQYHVDFYDSTSDITKKRALVREAIAWHRRKGTPAAVEELCTTVFQSAQVKEWYEYQGEPYHFRVEMIKEALPDVSVLDSLARAIFATKNTRSWLDGLCFYREVKGSFYFSAGMEVVKEQHIYPTKYKMPDIVQVNNFRTNIRQERSVTILCQTGTV